MILVCRERDGKTMHDYVLENKTKGHFGLIRVLQFSLCLNVRCGNVLARHTLLFWVPCLPLL